MARQLSRPSTWFRGRVTEPATRAAKYNRIAHSRGELLSVAALYEVRKIEDDWEVSCLMIACTGEDTVGEVNDRMPVFLTPDV